MKILDKNGTPIYSGDQIRFHYIRDNGEMGIINADIKIKKSLIFIMWGGKQIEVINTKNPGYNDYIEYTGRAWWRLFNLKVKKYFDLRKQ